MKEFSKLNFPELRQARKNLKNGLSNSDLFSAITELERTLEGKENSILKDGEFVKVRQFTALTIAYFGFEDNLFIDSKTLSDFVINNPITKQNIKDILENNSYIKTMQQFSIIHLYGIEKSVMFVYDKDLHTLLISNGSLFEYVNESNVNESGKEISKICSRIVVNTLLYMTAFPNKILNQAPDSVKTKKLSGEPISLKLNKDIEHYMSEHAEVSPHLRKGHFRFLGSDYYKEKQGQTIFINPTFVKGNNVKSIEE